MSLNEYWRLRESADERVREQITYWQVHGPSLWVVSYALDDAGYLETGNMITWETIHQCLTRWALSNAQSL